MATVPTHPAQQGSISDHATAADALRRRGFGPRVRRLHARIGKAHHQAEGMRFSRSLLNGQATPLQLAALIRALLPAYALLEERAPALAAGLDSQGIPWQELARREALEHDVAKLACLPATPASPAAASWLERLRQVADEAPHRLMAHIYVRYGGDLSGGQQLAEQANAIFATEGLPALSFWAFSLPIADLKARLHDGFETLKLSDLQEEELLAESELAFLLTQKLLAELGALETEAAAQHPRPESEG
jgi:heme oxygenase